MLWYVLLVVIFMPMFINTVKSVLGMENELDNISKQGRVYDYNAETEEFVLVK